MQDIRELGFTILVGLLVIWLGQYKYAILICLGVVCCIFVGGLIFVSFLAPPDIKKGSVTH